MNKKDVGPVLEELSKQYNFQETPEFITRIQNFLNEVARFINDFLRHLKVPVPGSTNTNSFADLLQLGLIVTGVICLIVMAFLAVRRMNKLKLKSKGEFQGALEIEDELDSTGWLKRAEQLASENEWNKACRALYLSVLYMLDENEILSYTPTRSNYEYWYALSRKKQLQGSFRELADLVDLIWFGDYTASQSDYNHCNKLSSRLLQTASTYAKVPDKP